MSTKSVLNDVAAERSRQLLKFGEQHHDPSWWYVILGEEFGEVGRAIYEHLPTNYREELIQVAAVAVAAVEDYDSKQ